MFLVCLNASALVLGVLAVVEALAAVFVAMVEVLTSVKAMVAVAVAAVAAVPVAVPVAAAVPSAKVAVTAAPTPEVVAKLPLTQSLTRAAQQRHAERLMSRPKAGVEPRMVWA